jgi:hypothetical protein
MPFDFDLACEEARGERWEGVGRRSVVDLGVLSLNSNFYYKKADRN